MSISNDGILTLSDFKTMYDYREVWVQVNSSSFDDNKFWSNALFPVAKFQIVSASVSYANFPPSFDAVLPE